MIRYIIIDDEQHAIDVVKKFCQKIPYLQLEGEFDSALAASTFVEQHMEKIDLVFLDIEMPRFSGIDFLQKYAFPQVIMVTASPNFALESYDYGVVDYLLKPFGFERFADAVAKAYTRWQKAAMAEVQTGTSASQNAVILKTERNKYVRLQHAEITYMEGAGNFTLIHTYPEDKSVLVSKRLKELEELFPSTGFQRIHKSHLINMDHFLSLEGNRILLRGGEKNLTLSLSFRKNFLEMLHGHEYPRADS